MKCGSFRNITYAQVLNYVIWIAENSLVTQSCNFTYYTVIIQDVISKFDIFKFHQIIIFLKSNVQPIGYQKKKKRLQ